MMLMEISKRIDTRSEAFLWAKKQTQCIAKGSKLYVRRVPRGWVVMRSLKPRDFEVKCMSLGHDGNLKRNVAFSLRSEGVTIAEYAQAVGSLVERDAKCLTLVALGKLISGRME